MSKKRIILSTIFILFSGCAIIKPKHNPKLDSDHDGVVDSRDKCKNTPFLILVDSSGCPIKKQAKTTTHKNY